MELEEMKHTWEALSKRVEKQELLTTQLIEKMTEQKIKSGLNKIGLAEYIGTIICYIGAAYLIVNFAKISELLLQICATLAILLLFVLPIISLQSVRALKITTIASQTYLETINSFARQKIKFQKLQKLNLLLGLLLLVTIAPVLSAIQGKVLSEQPYFWSLIMPLAVLFFLAFAFWVLRWYNNILKKTEKMLSDINN